MEELKKYDGKIIVIVTENCPACETLKIRVEKDQVLKNVMEFLPVEKSELAQVLAEQFDIRSVPAYISVMINKDKVYVCKYDDDLKEVEQCYEIEIEKKQ